MKKVLKAKGFYIKSKPCLKLQNVGMILKKNGEKMTCEVSDLKKELAKRHACYILITCDGPDKSGEMLVEMDYEGDAALASFLLQGAQKVIDEQNDL